MSRTDDFSRLSGPAAARVSAALQLVLADFQAAIDWAHATEAPPVATAVETAIQAAMNAARFEVGVALYEAHPHLRPAGFDGGAGMTAAASGGNDPITDEHEALVPKA